MEKLHGVQQMNLVQMLLFRSKWLIKKTRGLVHISNFESIEYGKVQSNSTCFMIIYLVHQILTCMHSDHHRQVQVHGQRCHTDQIIDSDIIKNRIEMLFVINTQKLVLILMQNGGCALDQYRLYSNITHDPI